MTRLDTYKYSIFIRIPGNSHVEKSSSQNCLCPTLCLWQVPCATAWRHSSDCVPTSVSQTGLGSMGGPSEEGPSIKNAKGRSGRWQALALQNCFTAKRNKKKCLLYDFQMCFATKEHLLRMKAICGSVLTMCSICGKVLVFFVYDILPVMSTYRVPRYHRDHSHFPSPALKHSTTAWGREKVDVCSHTFGF